MSDEKIYTNSQVEQLRDKIKKSIFATETLKVRDVRYASSVKLWKIKTAYHIEGHSSQFAENGYAHPVIINENIDGQYTNKFYVVVPTNSNRIVELGDDDTLIVKYIDLITL